MHVLPDILFPAERTGFVVMIYMTNKKTGSSFRFNPYDFAVDDQDGDSRITMKDFNIIFADFCLIFS